MPNGAIGGQGRIGVRKGWTLNSGQPPGAQAQLVQLVNVRGITGTLLQTFPARRNTGAGETSPRPDS